MPVNPKRLKKGLWWDRAFYVTHGCLPRSEACDHCWAARASHMRQNHPNTKIAAKNSGITTEAGAFNGTAIPNREALRNPFKVRKPAIWAIWDDLFYGDEQDRACCEALGVPFVPVPFSIAARVLEIVFSTPCHTYVLLTKRPGRMAEFFSKYAIDRGGIEDMITYDPEGDTRYLCAPDQWPLSNLVLGTTVESQAYVQRLDALFQSPARRYVASLSPLLGAVHLEPYIERLNGVLVEGETGPGARPMSPHWVDTVHETCKKHGTRFFFKHWGEYRPTEPGEKIYTSFDYDWFGDKLPALVSKVGHKKAGRLLHGRTWDDLPW